MNFLLSILLVFALAVVAMAYPDAHAGAERGWGGGGWGSGGYGGYGGRGGGWGGGWGGGREGGWGR
jgi:hypothetical protein